ncbi:MAG: 30S ribosome-binding factor RbfA [Chloroflexi bacterium]|nr:30S ribosome-binding factor RbfA [Chloroflexota bacterium]
MTQRTERIDELLRQEIGAMLEREVADPRIGFATVTSVETTPDLRHAKVWVSVIGGSAERTETIRALEHAMVFIRRELGTRLRLRRIPDLHVRLDDSIERGTRVLRLIDAIETGGATPDEPAGESLPTPTRAPIVPADAAADAAVDPPSRPDGFGAAAAEFAALRRPAARTRRRGRAR